MKGNFKRKSLKRKNKSINFEMMIIIAIIIIVIVIIGLVIKNVNRKEEAIIENNTFNKDEYEENKTPMDIPGTDNIQSNSDGTIENTSSKIKEVKNLEGLKIQIKSYDRFSGMTKINIEVTNTTEKVKEIGNINMNILDANSSKVSNIIFSLQKIEKGETVNISIDTQADLVNAFNVEFTK